MAVRKLKESQLSSQAYYDFYDFVEELNKDFASRGLEIGGSKVNGSDRNFMIYVYNGSEEIATIAIDYNESNYEWTMTFDFNPSWDETGEYDVYFDQTAKLDIHKLYPEIESAIDIIGDCLDDNSNFTESTTRKTTGKRMTENTDVNDAVMNDVLKKVKKFGIKCDELAELMASVYFIIKYDTRSLVSFTPDQAERICAELDKLYDILDTNVKIPDDLYDLIDEIPSSSKIGQGYDVFY